MKNTYLYTMRLDCPLTTPIINEFKSFMKNMGCKCWLIGVEEKKKESDTIHFHAWAYISYSENTVRKKFKSSITSFPHWSNSNSFSCSMKKKDNVSILKKVKKYKKDIMLIKSYPIKELKNIEKYLKKKTYRGIPKKALNEILHYRDNIIKLEKIKTLKKSKSDYLIMLEKVRKINLKSTYKNVVHKIAEIIIQHYTLIQKKIPYSSYIQSLIKSYLLSINYEDYQSYEVCSQAETFLQEHTYFFHPLNVLEDEKKTEIEAKQTLIENKNFINQQFKLNFD